MSASLLQKLQPIDGRGQETSVNIKMRKSIKACPGSGPREGLGARVKLRSHRVPQKMTLVCSAVTSKGQKQSKSPPWSSDWF